MFCYELLIDGDDLIKDFRVIDNYDRSNFEEAVPLLLERRTPGRVMREIPIDSEGNPISNIENCGDKVEKIPSNEVFTLSQAASIEVLDPELIEVIHVDLVYNLDQATDPTTGYPIWPSWGLFILQEQKIDLETLEEFKKDLWAMNYFGMYMKKEEN